MIIAMTMLLPCQREWWRLIWTFVVIKADSLGSSLNLRETGLRVSNSRVLFIFRNCLNIFPHSQMTSSSKFLLNLPVDSFFGGKGVSLLVLSWRADVWTDGRQKLIEWHDQ